MINSTQASYQQEEAEFKRFVHKVHETDDISLIDRVMVVSRLLIGFLDFPRTESLSRVQTSLRSLEDRLTRFLPVKEAYPQALKKLRSAITPRNAVKIAARLQPALSQIMPPKKAK